MDVWNVRGFEFNDWKGIKHLKVDELDGPIVLFTGKHKAGKTSAIDAFIYGLLGDAWCPPDPTRHGSKGYEVLIHLKGIKDGIPKDFTIRRTPTVDQILPKSAAWTSTQKMMEEICDELMLDPLEFIRVGKTFGKKKTGAKESVVGKREQVEMLKKSLVFEVDIEELETLNEKDKDARTEVGRQMGILQGDIRNIPVPTQKLPEKPIDLAEIQARIRTAQEYNDGIVGLIDARTKVAQRLVDAEANEKRNQELIEKTHGSIEKLTADLDAIKPAVSAAAGINDALDKLVAKAEEMTKVEGLARQPVQDSIKHALAQAFSYLFHAGRRKEQLQTELETARKTVQAAEKQRKPLAQATAEARLNLEMTPIPKPMDVPALTEELQDAITRNTQLGEQLRGKELEKKLVERQAEYDRLTRAMEARKEQRAKAIRNAKMPMEGLTYNDVEGKQEIYYDQGNGPIPLSQLSETEQLRVSIAVALARNPKLRVVRIPNGELLDDESMEELIKFAEEQKFVIFMAKASESEDVGIWLQDGEAKSFNPPIRKKGRR